MATSKSHGAHVSSLVCCCRCTHSLRLRYWANYGRKLFEFSFFEDQGVRTQNTTALALAAALKSDIPDNVVSEFVWRRQRNFNVSKAALASFFPSGSTSRVYMCAPSSFTHSFFVTFCTCASRWTTARPSASTSPSLSTSSQSSRLAGYCS